MLKQLKDTDISFADSYLQLIIDNLDEFFLIVDRNLKILLVNKKAAEYSKEILGFEIKIGMPVLELASPDRTQMLIHLYEDVLRGKTHYSEIAFDTSVKTKRILSCNYKPAYSKNGEIIAVFVTARDITEKKSLDLKISSSEKHYRLLFSDNPLPSWIYDIETLQFLEVNKAAINFYGYSKEEFLKLTLKDIRPPEDIPALNENLKNLTTKGIDLYNQWRHKKKNGEIVYVEIKSEPLRYKGKDARLTMVNDITMRVESEIELIKSNERFLLASKATSDAIWDWDLVTDEMKWGEGIYSLFGHYGNEVDTLNYYLLIHPDDRPKVKESLEEAWANPNVSTWHYNYRFKNVKDNYRYVMDHGFIVRDSNKRAVRMIGSIKDITDLKENEKQLLILNERFNIVAKATNDLIWDWNLETGEVFRDPEGIKKVYGVEAIDEIAHINNWVKHIHPDDLPKVEVTMQNIIKADQQDTFEVEYRFRRDDNTYSYIYDRGYIMRNANGKPYRMIGAAQDISERKRLENELLESELNRQKLISQATIDSQEKERNEISKELHDNVNQVLTTTKLYLDLAASNNELKDELIRKCSNNVIYVINEIRQLSRSLMLPSFGDLGLIDSIKDLVENINATHKLNVTFLESTFDETALKDNQKLMILRIIQEGLNNILRHAHASLATVHLVQSKKHVRLFIRDDGKGFNPKEVKPGAGLNNIQNRVSLFNGTLYIHSSPGKGSELIIDIPFPKNI
ncbi:MAG TPA: PAS domain S-box protein [Chitinophagaceae bacterium]